MSTATAGRRTARGSSGLPTIRWERVSRVALLALLVGLVFLAVRPAISYWNALHQSRAQRAQLSALEREHAVLEHRRQALLNPSVIEARARTLGYVRPGERAYVLRDLPRGP